MPSQGEYQEANAASEVSQGLPDFNSAKSEVTLKRTNPWKSLPGESSGSTACGVVMWLLFWAAVVYQLVTMFALIGGGNLSGPMEYQKIDCAQTASGSGRDLGANNGGSTYQVYYRTMDAPLKEDWCKCMTTKSSHGGDHHRLLAAAKDERSMMTLMGDYAHVPIVGVLVLCLVGCGWLFLLKKLGTSFIFVSLGLVCALLATCGILFIAWYDAVEAGAVVIGIAVAMAAYFVWRKPVVKKAGKVLEAAATGLFKNGSMFIVLGGVQLGFLAYIFLFIEALGASQYHVTVGHDFDCQMEPGSDTMGISWIMIWIVFYVDHMKLTIVGATLGHWAFSQPREEGGYKVALKALHWSMWHSSPTLASTSLICAFAQTLKKTVASKANWCNPLLWPVLLVGFCLLKVIQTYTRFMVVLHAIGGQGFYGSASQSYDLLIKGGNLEEAVSANIFVDMAMSLSSWILSMAAGILMFAWVDAEAHTNIANFIGDLMEMGGVEIWLPILLIVFGWLLSKPYFVLFVVTVCGLGGMNNGDVFAVVIFFFFVTAIARIGFNFFARTVLSAVDTMVMCYAIDKANGLVNAEVIDGRDESLCVMYGVIAEMVKDGGKVQVAPLTVAPLTAVVVATPGVVMGTVVAGTVQPPVVAVAFATATAVPIVQQ